MSALQFSVRPSAHRLGLKGPAAAQWLAGHGITLPVAPNSWAASALFVARLGTGEFFIEDAPGGKLLDDFKSNETALPTGVYPVIREDSAFLLSGEDVHDVLVQVCNVDFAGLSLAGQPIIMTSMIGVSVLVAPTETDDIRSYRIWCDPTFGDHLEETVGHIVIECGGQYTGVSR